MTREQIEALSDDPDEMAQQLQDIAGGNAVIRVDSFEGGRLPPKSMIKAIHITRDAFAAENHFAGGLFIDIITQPGMGPLRTNMNFRLRDGSMSGQAAGRHFDEQPEGPRADAELRRRLERHAAQAEVVVFDQRQRQHELRHAVLQLHAARRRAGDDRSRHASRATTCSSSGCSTTRSRATRRCGSITASSAPRRRNLGVGGFDLPRARYSNEDSQHTLQHPGGRDRSAAGSSSIRAPRSAGLLRRRNRCSKAPTIRVLDAVHERRAAADAAATRSKTHQPAVRSRLRARHPLGGAPVSSSTAASYHSDSIKRTTSGRTRSRASTAFRAEPAAQLHATDRRPEHRLPEPAGGLCTCRMTSGFART